MLTRFQWDFDAKAFENICLYFWASQWTYYGALGFCKFSILLQYLRIFPQLNFRRACHFLLVVTIIWTLWSVLSALFMCVPVPVFWQQVAFQVPQCMNRLIVWWVVVKHVTSETQKY